MTNTTDASSAGTDLGGLSAVSGAGEGSSNAGTKGGGSPFDTAAATSDNFGDPNAFAGGFGDPTGSTAAMTEITGNYGGTQPNAPPASEISGSQGGQGMNAMAQLTPEQMADVSGKPQQQPSPAQPPAAPATDPTAFQPGDPNAPAGPTGETPNARVGEAFANQDLAKLIAPYNRQATGSMDIPGQNVPPSAEAQSDVPPGFPSWMQTPANTDLTGGQFPAAGGPSGARAAMRPTPVADVTAAPAVPQTTGADALAGNKGVTDIGTGGQVAGGTTPPSAGNAGGAAPPPDTGAATPQPAAVSRPQGGMGSLGNVVQTFLRMLMGGRVSPYEASLLQNYMMRAGFGGRRRGFGRFGPRFGPRFGGPPMFGGPPGMGGPPGQGGYPGGDQQDGGGQQQPGQNMQPGDVFQDENGGWQTLNEDGSTTPAQPPPNTETEGGNSYYNPNQIFRNGKPVFPEGETPPGEAAPGQPGGGQPGGTQNRPPPPGSTKLGTAADGGEYWRGPDGGIYYTPPPAEAAKPGGKQPPPQDIPKPDNTLPPLPESSRGTQPRAYPIPNYVPSQNPAIQQVQARMGLARGAGDSAGSALFAQVESGGRNIGYNAAGAGGMYQQKPEFMRRWAPGGRVSLDAATQRAALNNFAAAQIVGNPNISLGDLYSRYYGYRNRPWQQLPSTVLSNLMQRAERMGVNLNAPASDYFSGNREGADLSRPPTLREQTTAGNDSGAII